MASPGTGGQGTAERPLHVLEMCTQFGVGGIARHVLDLSQWLRARGHRVSFGGTPDAWLDPEREPAFLTLSTRYVGADGANLPARLANAISSAAKLRTWLARNDVDVIHAHESAPALVARLATIGLSTPVAVTYHGSEPERVRQFGQIVRFADLVITPSHRAAEALAEIGGVERRKLKVIGLGVKTPPPVDPAEVKRIRRDLLGEDGSKLVVSISRLCEQKGIDIMIDCVRRTMSDHPELRFAVVGDGPDEEELKALAQREGVLSHLRFVGRSQQVPLYLAAADLFLLTSRWEALPITIVEAFRAGTPAVATDCSGVVELIDDSVGKVVPIGDVEAICQAVLDIVNDEGLRERMAANAAARSLEDRFSPDHINRIFETVYRDLAAGKA